MKYIIRFDKFYVTDPINRCSLFTKVGNTGEDVKKIIEEQTDRYKPYPEFFIVVNSIEAIDETKYESIRKDK